MTNWRVDASAVTSAETMIMSLAGVCNGAATWDGAGFSKFDTSFGHSLAQRAQAGRSWTVKQAHAALKLIRKYQRQLGGSVVVDAFLNNPVFKSQPFDPDAGVQNADGTVKKVTDRQLTSQDTTAVFRFKFDPAIVAHLKTIRGEHNGRKFFAAWDAPSRQWMVPVNETSIALIMAVATEFAFDIEPRFTEYAAKVAAKHKESVGSSTMMLAMNDGKNVTVIDDAIQIAITDPAVLAEFTHALKG